MIGSINLDRASGLDEGFDERVVFDPAEFRWHPVAPKTELAGWPRAVSSTLPEDYFPAGRSPDVYIRPADYLQLRLSEAGVIVPHNAADEPTLRRWLQSTTPSALPSSQCYSVCRSGFGWTAHQID